MAWWLNKYDCLVNYGYGYGSKLCNTQWEDEWSCRVAMECPTCDCEIEPYDSEDLTLMPHQLDADTWVVLASPEDADDDPDYETIAGGFWTQAEALAWIDEHRDGFAKMLTK